MPQQKVAMTLDGKSLDELDQLVAARQCPSRSEAIEGTLAEALGPWARTPLPRESALLDPAKGWTLAEEGLGAEGIEWPPY